VHTWAEGDRFGWNRAALSHVAQLEALGPSDPKLSREQRVVLAAIRRARQHALMVYREAFAQRRDGGAENALSEVGIFAVLLKPVGDLCNLRCTYCYEGVKGERLEKARMRDSTLEAIIGDVLAQARGAVQFIWHGGEPLLAGIELFRRGLNFQRQHNVNGCRIVNTVQTNGLLIDDVWLGFFKENGFNVGISIDGPGEMHDRFRIHPSGRGTYAETCKVVRRLKAAGFDVGAISVVTANSALHSRDLFETLRSMGITAYDIHPNFGRGTRPDDAPVQPKAFSDFVIELFDLWLASGDTSIRIRTFDDVYQGLVGYRPSTCYFSGRCTGILGFEATGEAVPCTRPFDRVKYSFGNIHSTPLEAIKRSARLEAFRIEDFRAQANSRKCPWYHICHNGCPQHRSTNGHQDVAGANLYCQCQSGIGGGYAAIFEHVVRRTEHLLGLEETAPTKQCAANVTPVRG
jgi:uncharacterized protein